MTVNAVTIQNIVKLFFSSTYYMYINKTVTRTSLCRYSKSHNTFLLYSVIINIVDVYLNVKLAEGERINCFI